MDVSVLIVRPLHLDGFKLPDTASPSVSEVQNIALEILSNHKLN